jgi:uncharacterized protein YqhQ
VVEGVMMRAPRATSVAVRRTDGSVVVRLRSARRMDSRMPWMGRPGLRGVAILVETMVDGMSALHFAASQVAPEETDGKPLTTGAIVATLAFSMAFGFFMFAFLPHLLTWLLGLATGSESLAGGRDVVFHLVDGVVKLALFVGFVFAISKMPDIRRVFQFHGAEHQAVHAFEHDQPLEVESLAGHPTAHARCGTAFLMTVIAVSILVFAGVFPLLPLVSEISALNQVFYIAVKIPLVLPIAGLSYEVIRLSARPGMGFLGVAISAPGVLVQRITTQTPDSLQQEIAIVALETALHPEGLVEDRAERLLEFKDYTEFRQWCHAGFPAEVGA